MQPITHTAELLWVRARVLLLKKNDGQEIVVFHKWLWESCLVYLAVLSFPELNKEHLEPVSERICSPVFCHMTITGVMIMSAHMKTLLNRQVGNLFLQLKMIWMGAHDSLLLINV